MFVVGDIVVVDKYCAIKSFAKITKITKTGKFRALPLDKQIIHYGDVDRNYCKSDRVVPGTTNTNKTILIQSNGKYSGNQYEKYDPNKEYYDVLDGWR